MAYRTFASVVTAAAAIMAGLALFGIAATGARAVTSHLWYGDLRSALIVGTIAALCFVSSLMFLMPGRLRRLIASRGKGYAPVLFAVIVLVALLIATAIVESASRGSPGLVPHRFIAPIGLSFALVFTAAFIFPGLAYPANSRSTPLHSPWVQFAVQSCVFGYGALFGLALYAWAFKMVLPDPEILEASRKYIGLIVVLSLLPIWIPMIFAQSPRGSAARGDFIRAGLPMTVVVLLMNSLTTFAAPKAVLPWAANAVLWAKPDIWPMIMIAAKPNSALPGCGARITFLLNPETGREYSLCNVPKSTAQGAKPGDVLFFTGMTSGYGLVIERLLLFPVPNELRPVNPDRASG